MNGKQTEFELPVRKLDESRQGEVYAARDKSSNGNEPLFYIESYGCQMNFSDSEIVASVLQDAGFGVTTDYRTADLILVNTCSIRENAEQRVRKRLSEFNAVKKRKPGTLVGVLGCMAERLKKRFLEEEQIIDIVVGPDGYRSLPDLVAQAGSGQKAVNVLLSREETYADISPVRLDSNGVSAFISIMRGCDNMCSFCVVPFTRGRERSRDPESIVQEARELFENGYREVTLLGQNVDSYRWESETETVNFAGLLERVACIHPDLRVRFSTSHPKDMTDEVLHTMARYENICKYIHLPLQSGSSRILEKMTRTYDRDWYMGRIEAIRRIVPECAISTDIIAGFCSETEEDHRATLEVMQQVRYEMAYMFAYSERPGTLAARKYEDDVPEGAKKKRLNEIIRLQQQHSYERNKADIGKEFKVLVEGPSKRSEEEYCGRNSQNKMLVFAREGVEPGQYVMVRVTSCTSATLRGEITAKL